MGLEAQQVGNIGLEHAAVDVLGGCSASPHARGHTVHRLRPEDYTSEVGVLDSGGEEVVGGAAGVVTDSPRRFSLLQ